MSATLKEKLARIRLERLGIEPTVVAPVMAPVSVANYQTTASIGNISNRANIARISNTTKVDSTASMGNTTKQPETLKSRLARLQQQKADALSSKPTIPTTAMKPMKSVVVCNNCKQLEQQLADAKEQYNIQLGNLEYANDKLTELEGRLHVLEHI